MNNRRKKVAKSSCSGTKCVLSLLRKRQCIKILKKWQALDSAQNGQEKKNSRTTILRLIELKLYIFKSRPVQNLISQRDHRSCKQDRILRIRRIILKRKFYCASFSIMAFDTTIYYLYIGVRIMFLRHT